MFAKGLIDADIVLVGIVRLFRGNYVVVDNARSGGSGIELKQFNGVGIEPSCRDLVQLRRVWSEVGDPGYAASGEKRIASIDRVRGSVLSPETGSVAPGATARVVAGSSTAP